ncbi:hypothetical protein EC844_12144 [Acinetobacter calcoaceticus]|uniref:Uncharacterized protein n=1 Tax=Acinetobacter calcoaceticus TaxID=471 RepID=A0A4R1XJ80_ACICA|nr:hypothetical protein EC844_12144 [Acinetobacter calcoaceticus]
MSIAKTSQNIHAIHHPIRLTKLLGYAILYCGSLVLLSKIFLAIL